MDYIGIFLLIILLGWSVLFGMKLLLDRGFIACGLCGVGTLFLLSTLFSKAVIGLNLLTVSVSFLLGVPGVIGLLLLRMVTIF